MAALFPSPINHYFAFSTLRGRDSLKPIHSLLRKARLMPTSLESPAIRAAEAHRATEKLIDKAYAAEVGKDYEKLEAATKELIETSKTDLMLGREVLLVTARLLGKAGDKYLPTAIESLLAADKTGQADKEETRALATDLLKAVIGENETNRLTTKIKREMRFLLDEVCKPDHFKEELLDALKEHLPSAQTKALRAGVSIEDMRAEAVAFVHIHQDMLSTGAREGHNPPQATPRGLTFSQQ